jgi:hypothetical protein
MFDQTTPFGYGGNLGGSFLHDSMQQSMAGPYGGFGGGGGLVGQQFGNVMDSMSGGIQNSAQMGIMPGQQMGLTPQQMRNLTPQQQAAAQMHMGQLNARQVAAQMQMGGPMSALPLLGNRLIPHVVYPLAGVWTIISGAGAMRSANREAKQLINNKFDPRQLEYERSLRDMHEVSARWSHLGPMHTRSGY